MGSYDKQNALKEKYQKQIDELQSKLDKAYEDNRSLKEEIKNLKYERYQDGRGVGEVDKLKKEINKLQKEVERYKQLSFTNESYEVFDADRQKLIKDIKDLKSKHQHINDLFHKFQTGTNQILTIAKLSQKGTLTIRDCYTYVFRDTLISLLEKTLQVLTGKMTRTLNSILYDLTANKVIVKEEFLKAIPELKEKGVYRKLQYLVYLENTAFHGYTAETKTTKKEAVLDSQAQTEEFLKLKSEDQLDTIFTLLKILYTAFTCSSSEYILTQISGCWKYTIS